MSREEETELNKEVTHLRLQLHHAEMQVERLTGTVNYFRIEARDFEAKWLRVMEENEKLRKALNKVFLDTPEWVEAYMKQFE